MRKICLTLFAVVLLVCGCGKKTETAALEDGKIYFFYYNECPYCHDAIDYIDRQYPNLNMAMVNIHVGNGFELFKACGEKFRLGNSIGTRCSAWATNTSWAGPKTTPASLTNTSNPISNNKTLLVSLSLRQQPEGRFCLQYLQNLLYIKSERY